MANRDCNGDFFTADGVRYYRCLWDSTVMLAPAQGDNCPHCDRIIDGTEAGEWSVRTVRIAISPGGLELRMPETPNAELTRALEDVEHRCDASGRRVE